MKSNNQNGSRNGSRNSNARSNSLILKLRFLSLWLSSREDIPKKWIQGGYSRIKFARLVTAIVLLLNASIFIISSSFMLGSGISLSTWYIFQGAIYLILSIVFLLGLRMWYGPSLLFLLASIIINLAFPTNIIAILFYQPAATIISLSMLYLALSMIVLMRYDSGSKINEMLRQS